MIKSPQAGDTVPSGIIVTMYLKQNIPHDTKKRGSVLFCT